MEKNGNRSVSDFFSVAAENQLLIEEMTAGTAADASLLRHMQPVAEQNGKLSPGKLGIPEQPAVRTIALPPAGGGMEESMVSGQTNRILPMKVGLRVLCALLSKTNEEYVPLKEFVAAAVIAAQQFRNVLVGETMHISGKKDSLWSGLPEAGSDMSGLRYRNQFLAYPRQDDGIEGGLGKLRFAGVLRKAKKTYIGITGPGLGFAALENPVIDRHLYGGCRFSEEEVRFYLAHIRMAARGEYKTFRDVLGCIARGAGRTGDLNSALEKLWSPQWTGVMVNTHRNGAVSRMAELGLIAKEKKGKEVEFKLTQTGREFIEDRANEEPMPGDAGPMR